MTTDVKIKNDVPPPTIAVLQRHLWFWAGALAITFLLLWVLKGVLLPFIIGMAVAYFLDPVTRRLEHAGMGRALATSVVLLCFAALFVLAAMLTFPVLQGQFIAFAETVPAYIAKLRELSAPWIEKLQTQILSTPPEKIQQQAGGVATAALSWATGALKKIWDGGVALFDILSILLIAPVVSFYMLRDWPVMVGKVDNWLPRRHAETIRGLLRQMDSALGGFVRGQAMVCLVLGLIYAIALSVAGLNFGFFIGFAAGILSFIPYVGTLVGFATGMLVCWFQFDGDTQKLILIAAIFGIGQLLEGNVLTPKLVGDKIGLHALWILFALMAGGALLGFTGVMIAVPVAAVSAVLIRFGIAQYLQSSYYHDDAPPKRKIAAKG
ncbi:MAG: AI-2E family transporter [Alphaproteobacteria bacterium]|nr:AI-2E family transporter [Alphaproteobacteria bacterium]